MAKNSEKRTFFSFFSKKNGKTICITKKSCTFASQMSLGLWCNGNTADSGPAFPGSSPGSPTKRDFRMEISLLFIYSAFLEKRDTPSHCCNGVSVLLGSFYQKQFSVINFTRSSFGMAPAFAVYCPSIGMKSSVGMPVTLNALAISGASSTFTL